MGTTGHERKLYGDVGRIATALERLAGIDRPPRAVGVPPLVDLAAYVVENDSGLELREASTGVLVAAFGHPRPTLADLVRAATEHAGVGR